MKKIFSVFLALTMLVGMMAMFAVTTSAADELLKVVGVYRINGNNDDLYVVFNKKVAAPAAENDLQLVLAAHGWNGAPDGFDKANTIISRVTFFFDSVYSDQVFKFKREGHVSWACDGGNIGGENVAVTPVNGFWFWGLAGTTPITTADGVETLVNDIPVMYDCTYGGNVWSSPTLPCHTIATTTNGAVSAAASAADITVPAPLDSIDVSKIPLKVVAAYRVNGNNDDLYVVFNKKVATPAAGNDLQLVLAAYGWGGVPADWDAANTSIARVHFPFTEAVSDQVFKFTRAGHVSWACDGGNINGEHPVAVAPVNGFWFWGLAGNSKVTTADGVETLAYDIDAMFNVYGAPASDPWTASMPCHTIATTTSGALAAVAAPANIVAPAPLAPLAPAPSVPSLLDFEKFAAGYMIAGSEHEGVEDGFYRAVGAPATVVEKDGSKVLSLDFSAGGVGFLRAYGASPADACKPVATYGSKFTMSYRVFLDVPEGAGSLIFRDRITDSKDNAGFDLLSIWSNGAVESANGQIAWGFSFGKWATITNVYDFENATVSTYIDDKLAFSQNLPTGASGNIDWSDICYHALGKNANDTATGIVYLDDVKWESGANAPETQAPETQAPETQAPTTQAPTTQAPEVSTDDVVVPPQGDVLSVVALVAVVGILGTAVVAKKRK